MKRFLMISVLTFVAACTQPVAARQTLEAEGYSHIEMTGYDFFACSKDDNFRDGFRARTVTGREVVGVVCAGFFKGQTIRILRVEQ